jgi:hypothetical protein
MFGDVLREREAYGFNLGLSTKESLTLRGTRETVLLQFERKPDRMLDPV